MVDVIPSLAALLPKSTFLFQIKKLVISLKLLITIFSFVGFNCTYIFHHFARTTLLVASVDNTGISVADGLSTLGKTASTFSGFLESTLLNYFNSAISY